MKTILVDDEESARDVLHNLLVRFCPDVEIVGKYPSVPDAAKAIQALQPDLVILDIEMPNYAGYEIVKFFNEITFDIIFVTAYDKYALKAFEVSAMDYLLKPVDIERLKTAIEKVKKSRSLKEQLTRLDILSNSLQTREIKNLVLFEKGSQHIVSVDSIIAIEAQESYCLVHTLTRKYLISKNLKHFESMLDGVTNFIRVHKSWIVSKSHIQSYSRTEFSILLTNNLIAKLSKFKKTEFEKAIK